MMDTIDDIMNKLPYNSYADLFSAILSGKADMKFQRSDIMEVASIQKPHFSKLGIYIPFLLSLAFIIWFCVQVNSWWLLLTIPLNFLLTFSICHMPKFHRISFVLIVLAFFINIPLWLLTWGVSVLIIHYTYNIWWSIVSATAVKELTINEGAFVWLWNRYSICIIDSYGNTYSRTYTSSTSDEHKQNKEEVYNFIKERADQMNLTPEEYISKVKAYEEYQKNNKGN